MKNVREKQIKLCIIALLLCIILLSIFYAKQKKGYHVDEILTMGLSNSSFMPFPSTGVPTLPLKEYCEDNVWGNSFNEFLDNIFIIAKDCKTNGFKGSEFFNAYRENKSIVAEPEWLDQQIWLNYVSVSSEDKFNPLGVYYNQLRDVHPPFFYLLVNFFSSMFKNNIPKYVVIGINLSFGLGTCLLLYRLVKKRTNSEFSAIITMAFYGLSMAFFSTVIFMRMYAIFTFFILFSVLVHQYVIHTDEKINKKLVFLLIFSSVLGFYTHYYFIIFLFFESFIILIHYCFLKKYKVMFEYIATMMMAGIISLLIWPASLIHIFKSYRGTQAVSELFANGFFQKIQGYISAIIESIFSGIPLIMIVWLVSLIILAYNYIKYKNLKKKLINKTDNWLLIVPSILYFSMVVKIAPYNTDRYIMCLFPLICYGIVATISKYSKFLRDKRKENIVVGIFVVVLLVVGFVREKPNYLYKQSESEIKFNVETKGLNCIYVNSGWIYYTERIIDFIENDNNVLILDEKQLEYLKKDKIFKEGNKFVLYISDSCDKNYVLKYFSHELGMQNSSISYQEYSVEDERSDTAYWLFK